MNKTRRADIERAILLIAEGREILENARDEEQEYFDNMPESFQDGEKGEKAQAAIDAIDGAITSAEEAEGQAQEAIEA